MRNKTKGLMKSNLPIFIWHPTIRPSKSSHWHCPKWAPEQNSLLKKRERKIITNTTSIPPYPNTPNNSKQCTMHKILPSFELYQNLNLNLIWNKLSKVKGQALSPCTMPNIDNSTTLLQPHNEGMDASKTQKCACKMHTSGVWHLYSLCL